MAKNGQKIDSLYLSIGLDVDQLQLDFDTAGKTVSQTMARLNSEIKQLKIKTSIDTSKLSGVGTDVDKIRVKEQGLTKEIELQTQKMNILAAAYKSAQAQYGNDSGITRKAETSLLGQQAAVEKLKASLRGLAAEEAKIGAGSTGLARIREGAQSARAGIDKVSSGYTMLSGKMMAFMAFASTGAGLFSITDSAMQAGENLYKLKTRLHTSTEEAAKLGRVFAMCGVDINSAIPMFARLDKQFLSAGSKGNDLTMAMQHFGITLTDSAGNLLPINEQLDQLAKGYQNAAAAGDEEAYTSEVLGARGAALVPLLQDYATQMEIANHIKTTSLLNPDEAHKLYMQWQEMKGDSANLGSALSAALMPIAQDLMPEVTDGFKTMIEYIKDNKDDIKNGIESWGSALKSLVGDAVDAAKAVADVGNAIANNDIAKGVAKNVKERDYDQGVLEANGAGNAINAATALGAGVGGFIGRVGGTKGALVGAGVGAELFRGIDVTAGRVFANATGSWDDMVANYDAQKQAAEEAAKAKDEDSQATDKNAEADKNSLAAAKKNAEAQKEAAKAEEVRKQATAELTEEIYNLTHSDYDNAVHSMQKKIADAINKHVDQSVIDDYRSSEMAKINKDIETSVFEPISDSFKTDLDKRYAEVDRQAQRYREKAGSALDEGRLQSWEANEKGKITADWDRQVAEQIDSIWRSEYQNQMVRIENEKKAWIDKGLSEVQSARWAAEEKRQIQQKSAQDMFTSNYKLLQLFRSVRMGGGSIQQAAEEMAAQMRKDKGIPDGAFTTPREISEFNEAMKAAQDNLVPILSDSVYDGVKRAMIEVQRGTNTAYEDPYGRYRIDLGNAGQDFSGRVASAGSAFHDSVYSAGSVLHGRVYRSGQEFYESVNKGAGKLLIAAASAANSIDNSRLWNEKDAEHVHDITRRWNNGERMPDFDIHKWGTYPGWSQAQAQKILKDNEKLNDPNMYGDMDPQRAIMNANMDPFTALLKDTGRMAREQAMAMARSIMPSDYADSMPRRVGVRPEPRRHDQGDYRYPATPNVTVNINNPVTVNEKTIQAQVAQGVDEGMSKVAEIINRTNKIDNY